MANIFRPTSWLKGGSQEPQSDRAPASEAAGQDFGGELSTETLARSANQAESSSRKTPLRERIEQTAYFLWLQDGCPEGKDVDYWLKAEQEILEQRNRRG